MESSEGLQGAGLVTKLSRCRRGIVAGTVVAVLVVGSIGPAVTSAGAQDETRSFPTADVVPEDALAYVNVPLVEASKQWEIGRELLERSGLTEILVEAEAGMDGVPLDAFLGGEAGLVVTEAALVAAAAAGAGELTSGFVPEPDASPVASPLEPAAQGWAVVLDARAPDTAYAGLVAALEDQAGDLVEIDYEGVAISFSDPSAAADAESADTPLAAARIDDLVLIAGAPSDLEPLIDTAQGSSLPLAEAEPFLGVTAALPTEFLMLGYVNQAAALEAQAGLGGAGLPVPPGLTGPTTYSGFVIQADDPGFRMETVAIATGDEQLPPAAANYDSALLGRTPADALFFLSAPELGATGALQNLGAIGISLAFGQFGGADTPTPAETGAQFVDRQYQELAALLGFNLKTDVFDQLTGEYGAWVRANAGSESIEALFASGVADSGTVVNALSRLNLLVQGAGGGTTTVTTRSLAGSTVNVVETGPGVPAFEYGVVGDRLLIGFGGAIDTDAGGGEALADNPLFSAVLDELPEERNGTIYVDLTRVIPLVEGLAGAGGDLGLGGGEAAVEDAAVGCADYATQAEAQAAYDGNEEGTFDLDQDFDGTVCEDFFGTSPDAAAPDAGAEVADALAEVDLSGIEAFALAAYDEAGMRRSSSILYIAE